MTSGPEADAAPAGRPVTTPPPSEPPQYLRPPGKRRAARSWTATDVVDGAFFLFGALLVVWLAWILLLRSTTVGWGALAYLVIFWLLLAYVGLPRVQEVLARAYVPDYFIGRTVTEIGVLGDPVNLALDGDAAQVHAAMSRAGWTRADEVTLRSSVRIVVSAVLRRSYPAAPVSPLLLFGRREAFAYEQEVDGNASQRHHVRFWPVPPHWCLPGGARVGWLAAATYDRAVGLSLFTLQVTHKIDADIDVERDYVVATVRYADPDVRERVVEGFATAFHTRNGGGDLVRSDGDLPVLDVRGVAAPDPGPPARPAPRHDLGSRRLPPPMLLLAGLLGVVKAALPVLTLLLAAVGATTSPLDGLTPFEGVVMLAGAVGVVVLWGLVLLRRRFARTLLMAVCAYEAATQLMIAGGQLRPSPLVLATAGLAVLILIAVSSGDARRWVEPAGAARTGDAG